MHFFQRCTTRRPHRWQKDTSWQSNRTTNGDMETQTAHHSTLVSARRRRLYPALGRRLRSPTRGTDQPNAARLTREGELSTHRSRRQCTARLFDRRPEKTLRGCTRRRGDSQDAPTERPSRTVALLSDSNGSLPLHRGRIGPLPMQSSESYCNRASSGTGGDLGCSGTPVFTNSQIHKRHAARLHGPRIAASPRARCSALFVPYAPQAQCSIHP